nr:NAD-binding protein [archaeon]
MKRIGFIGLGLMGAGMSKNLLKAGYPVTVWNRTASKMEPLVEAGAKAAGSPREVAENSDVVIGIVTDSPDVEQVLLGPDGVIHGAREGMICIDMSTISPITTREVSAKLAEKGVKMLDAPVSGGVIGANNGTLSIMVGGDEGVFDECLPIFEAMGKTITLVGGIGDGQVTKAVNQILVGTTMLGVAEALVFAKKAGVDVEKCHAAVSGGAAGSWQLTNNGGRVLRGDMEPGFKIKDYLK